MATTQQSVTTPERSVEKTSSPKDEKKGKRPKPPPRKPRAKPILVDQVDKPVKVVDGKPRDAGTACTSKATSNPSTSRSGPQPKASRPPTNKPDVKSSSSNTKPRMTIVKYRESHPDAEVLPSDRVAKLVAATKVWIPPGSDPEPLTKMQIPVEEREGYSRNAHYVSAAMRYYAGYLAAATLASRYSPHRVQCSWGSVREVKILDEFFANVGLDQPHEVSQDGVREQRVTQVHDPDAHYLTDVYTAGDQSLFEWLVALPTSVRVVCVIHKRFNGLFGDTYHEGAWYRDATGNIIACSDDETEPHPAHPALNWLARAGTDGQLSWAPYKTVGLERISFVVRGAAPHAEAYNDTPEGCVQLFTAPPYGLKSILLGYVVRTLPAQLGIMLLRRFCELEYYDAAFVANLTEYINRRRLTTYTYLGLQEHASRTIMSMYPKFCALFPQERARQVARHVQAVWFNFVVCRTPDLASLGLANEGGSLYNTLLDNLASSNPFNFSFKTIIIIASVLVILFKFRSGLAFFFVPWPKMNILRIPGAEILEDYCCNRWKWPAIAAGTCLEYWRNGWASAALFATFQTATSFGLVPLWFKSALHLMSNACSSSTTPTAWDLFVLNTHRVPWATRGWDYTRISATRYPIGRCVVAREATCNTPFKELCPRLVANYSPIICEDVAVRGSATYYYLPTNVPLYIAAKNGHTLTTAVRARLLAQAPNFSAQEKHYKRFHRTYVQREPLIQRTPEIVEEYLAHFPSGKQQMMRRVMAEYDRLMLQPLEGRTRCVEIMVKSDEYLVRPDFEFKPRVIAAVNPLVQCATGPILRVATARLHRQWSLAKPVLTYAKLDYYILFCAGLTDMEIGAALDKFLANPCVIICVCGDDSVVFVHSSTHRTVIYENDMSMFDQSQSTAILNVEYRQLEALGVGEEVIQWLRSTSRAPYIYTHPSGETLRIRRTLRPFRDTGAGDTSLGNSIVCAIPWMELLTRRLFWDAEGLIDAFAQRGFKAKARIWTDWQRVGFLKGKWYTTIFGDHVWAPLPSRFLKMGKVAKDPRLKPKDDLQGAILDFAQSIASTYQQYGQVPLIRTYVDKYYVCGHPTAHQQLEWMVKGTRAVLLDPLDEVAQYYDVDKSWFQEVESMISQSVLFTFLEHPLFHTLAQRDYM